MWIFLLVSIFAKFDCAIFRLLNIWLIDIFDCVIFRLLYYLVDRYFDCVILHSHQYLLDRLFQLCYNTLEHLNNYSSVQVLRGWEVYMDLFGWNMCGVA